MTERTQRVAENIKEELGRMFERGEIKDPRIGFVTFTDAKVSKDLRHAKIFFSSLGDDKAKQGAIEGLMSARGHIRTELGRRLRLKYMPDIEFIYDESVEASARISRLIHQIHERQENPD